MYECVNEKEVFKLRLKGFWYKGTINDWYYGWCTAFAKFGFPIIGNATHLSKTTEVNISSEMIEKKERIDGEVMLFLMDGSVYKLGTKKTL